MKNSWGKIRSAVAAFVVVTALAATDGERAGASSAAYTRTNLTEVLAQMGGRVDWSSDANTIYYDDVRQGEVMRMNPDGSNEQCVTCDYNLPDTSAGQPVSDASGRWLVVQVVKPGNYGPQTGPGAGLYVVEVGKVGADPIRIQDPANRVRQYFLDSGWRIADEERERVVRRLPQLLVHAEPPAGTAVPFIDWCDGVTQLGWIDVDIEQPSPDAFALQIAGDALGLALRGGVVVTSPGQPEEHDWVVVRLAQQLDPDTGAAVCIRQWVPERDFGGTLLGVRLQSDGSIPPITIEDPSTVQILGIVSHQVRVDDLSTVSTDG